MPPIRRFTYVSSPSLSRWYTPLSRRSQGKAEYRYKTSVDPLEELRSSFFKNDAWQFNRCLAPQINCTAKAIRAHSLQNSQVLDLVVRGGHIKAIRKKIDAEKGPTLFFDDVGRNEATTFTGFCSEHDSAIFKPIDVRPFDQEDPEHLFLVAYRAVVRELHAVMEGACKVQSTYLRRVELGMDSGQSPSPAGMLAIEHMIKSYETYLYKCQFDKALISRQFDAVLHNLLELNHERPSVAVCSLFSIQRLQSITGDAVRIGLNVLPLSANRSIAAFSYLPEDAFPVNSALSSILVSKGSEQKYLLSKMILKHCENFVVCPSYYDEWSEMKRDAIIDYFTRTLFTDDFDSDSEHLCLF